MIAILEQKEKQMPNFVCATGFAFDRALKSFECRCVAARCEKLNAHK